MPDDEVVKRTYLCAEEVSRGVPKPSQIVFEISDDGAMLVCADDYELRQITSVVISVEDAADLRKALNADLIRHVEEFPQFSDHEHFKINATDEWIDAVLRWREDLQKKINGDKETSDA